IYVLEPEVLRHVPTDRPYDFSKELFPLLPQMPRPLHGYVFDEYWQDNGNLDQFRQANFDALDEAVSLHVNGTRLRGTAWPGEVALGAQSVVHPGVRIYPYKEVETGSEVTESLIFESRAASRLWSREGVSGLINVDVTPEVAVRLAAALGTALKRGDRVVCSR